jgi:hypothetical protein
MVMTAYFDESGTHGQDSPAVIFGGFAANEGLWAIFEEQLKELLKKYRIETFHAKDFRQRRGAFRNLSIEEYGAFNSRFIQLIDSCLIRGIVIVLPTESYRKLYRPRFFKKKTRPDSEYGLCFRAAMLKSLFVMEDYPREFPIVPVLESGHRNAPDALRIYEELKIQLGNDWDKYLGPLAFEDKRRCLPLAAADSIVYSMFRRVCGSTSHENPHAVPTGPAFPPYYAGASPRKAKITRIVIDDETLDYLSSDLC